MEGEGRESEMDPMIKSNVERCITEGNRLGDLAYDTSGFSAKNCRRYADNACATFSNSLTSFCRKSAMTCFSPTRY